MNMILNKRQLIAVDKEINDLKEQITKIKCSNAIMDIIQVGAWENRINELMCLVDEFNKLTGETAFEFSVNDLSKLVISLRVASGMTQKQLAEAIEVKEQQIQRYEQSDYLTASFERVVQIVRVLCKDMSLAVLVKKEKKNDRFGEIHQIYPHVKDVVADVIENKSLMKVA